jgi:mono/diheme cytochrome c family protein
MDNRSIVVATFRLAAIAVLISTVAGPVRAQGAANQGSAGEELVPKFEAAYMSNSANIEIGQGVWAKQCRHCHGNSAYPGKAPKLKPGGLEPDFIFDRVTNGFRGMPAWKAVFTLEERMGVVAYIKSNTFSP